MDARLYKLAYERKSGTSLELTRRRPSMLGRLTQAELFLRCDMAANKAAWTGSMLQDLWLWTKNTNPLIALCASHKVHPVSRLERYYIFFLQVLLFAYVAIELTRIDVCDQWFASHGDPRVACGHQDVLLFNPHPRDDYHGIPASSFCCVPNMRLLLSVQHSLDPDRHRWWAGTYAVYLPIIGLTAVATLTNIVLGQLWFLLAGCQCCQQSVNRTHWEWLGVVVLLAFGLGPLTYLVWMLAFFHGRLLSTAYSFVWVKLLSVLGSTIVQTTAFLILWRAEMDGTRGDKLYLTVHDVNAYLAAEGSHTATGAAAIAAGSSTTSTGRMLGRMLDALSWWRMPSRGAGPLV